MKVIGLMSGTSLDGLDVILVDFKQDINSTIKWKIIASETIRYSDEWLFTLEHVYNLSTIELLSAHKRYGAYLGEIVKAFLTERKQTADLIASHGHSIFHEPNKGFSFQLGDGNSIAASSGMTTAYDFRNYNMALGGQGAPLVPIGDALLFSEFSSCINLGGIANISYNQNSIRQGFDCCPFNLLFNHYARRKGCAFDRNGAMARNGKPIPPLIEKLNQHSYYQKKHPKSLDKGEVLKEFIPIIDAFDGSLDDIQHSLCLHFAEQIGKNIKGDHVLLTGGGAFHSFFIEVLERQTGLKIELPNKEIIEFKEALIFALLGYLRFNNQINTLSSASGGLRDCVSGALIHA